MLDTIQYYKWLESQGVDYSSVRGLAKLPTHHPSRPGFGKLLSVKLEDGSVKFKGRIVDLSSPGVSRYKEITTCSGH